MRPYRSLLFVPAHKPDWAMKALASGADAVVIDLEDSVAENTKEAARSAARESVERLRAESERFGIFVRTNAWHTGLGGLDLEAVTCPSLTGVFLPKVETAVDVVRWDALLDYFGRRSDASALEMIIPVETVAAIQNCREIASASPRVGAMVVSTSEYADIARAVGYRQTEAGLESLYFRSRVLLACREAGIHPVTGLWEELSDLPGLASFATRSRDLGFRGQIVIHPSHVAPVNIAFTPSPEEVEFYQGLLAAVDAGAREGRGAVRYRGKHVDLAHAETARTWLAEYEQLR